MAEHKKMTLFVYQGILIWVEIIGKYLREQKADFTLRNQNFKKSDNVSSKLYHSIKPYGHDLPISR